MCPKISLSKRESCFSLYFNWFALILPPEDGNIRNTGRIKIYRILITKNALHSAIKVKRIFFVYVLFLGIVILCRTYAA